MNAVDLGEPRLRAVCVNAPPAKKRTAEVAHVVWSQINSISDKGYHGFTLSISGQAPARRDSLFLSVVSASEKKEMMLAQYAASTRTDYFVCVKCASNIEPPGESISLMLSANFIPILSPSFMRFTYEGSTSLAMVDATCSWKGALQFQTSF